MEKIEYLFSHMIIIFAAALAFACPSENEFSKIHHLENYRSYIHMPIADRTSAPPEMLRRYLSRLDNRRDYEPYTPSHSEKTIIKNGFALLPERTRSVLQKRLVGIYFIKNFTGNGLSDWVLDQSGAVFVFFVFNPSAFG